MVNLNILVNYFFIGYDVVFKPKFSLLKKKNQHKEKH